MFKINVGGKIITYSTKRTRRRTIQLKLVSPERLEVTAPLDTSRQQIEQLLQTKTKWLTQQIARLRAIADNSVNNFVSQGATALYLGQCVLIAILASNNANRGVILHDNVLNISTIKPDSADEANQVLRKWYIQQATALLYARTTVWSAKIGVHPQRITIRDQKTRWGSCSVRGNINYNWRIIMAPPRVIDYLIVHELCHLIVPNHSAMFWTTVAAYLPDFKQHQAWLKSNGLLLMRFLATTADA